jgi:hypothetical protein
MRLEPTIPFWLAVQVLDTLPSGDVAANGSLSSTLSTVAEAVTDPVGPVRPEADAVSGPWLSKMAAGPYWPTLPSGSVADASPPPGASDTAGDSPSAHAGCPVWPHDEPGPPLTACGPPNSPTLVMNPKALPDTAETPSGFGPTVTDTVAGAEKSIPSLAV